MTHSSTLTYIGHATILIEMNGVRLLTDPILRNWVWHLRRRTKINRAWYQNIDAVLISHIHLDHLDLPSLKLLSKATPLILPRGAASLLHRQGFEQVTEMTVDETINIGTLSIKATYAQHDGGRFRFGRAFTDCLGFVVSGRHAIYFAGDTDLFPKMANLAGNLDVALLPVWGWGPTLGTGHLNPYQAAVAVQMLRPRLAIPIHWGTFFPFGLGWLMPRLLIDPPRAFAGFAAKLAPEIKTQIVPPGGSIMLDEVLRR